MSASPVRVPVHRILRYPESWPRFALDPERVSLFAGLYAEHGPDALPPVEVVPGEGNTYVLAEGWTRYAAILQLGWDEITAVMLPAPADADPKVFAFEHALASCTRSSLPLTRAERREAGKRLIQARSDLSDGEIAEALGVDRTTALRWRHELEDRGGSANAQAADEWGEVVESSYQVARRLFRGIEAIHGLGLANTAFKGHTGRRLADIFREAYGERALKRAQQFRSFLDVAISSLREVD
jgi:hypothetical protein